MHLAERGLSGRKEKKRSKVTSLPLDLKKNVVPMSNMWVRLLGTVLPTGNYKADLTCRIEFKILCYILEITKQILGFLTTHQAYVCTRIHAQSSYRSE